jgi:hypothetical protein
MISKCVRSIDRDKGLTLADWRKFFEAIPTPWVYKAHEGTPERIINTAMNAKAYISNVVFHDDHFTYDLNLLDGFSETDHLEHFIEPVYGIIFRGGKAIQAEIKFLEFYQSESARG